MDTVDWNSLPSLALHQVFTYLPPKSRVAASSTCKHWRTALYHPLFWHDLALDISSSSSSYVDAKSKVEYANENLMTLVRNVWLMFDSSSTKYFELASSVVKALLANELLKNVDIELNHSDLSKNARFQDTSIPWLFSKRFYQEQFESIVLKVLQKGNIEGFSFRYLNFYNWHSLIHVLAKNNAHSLRRLEFSGLEPTVLLEQSEIGSTLISMSSLMNLQKLSLDLNSITHKLLPALCSMPQLEILVLHVHEKLDMEMSDDIWDNLQKYCPKLELRLTLIKCNEVAKNLGTMLLRPSMPLTHLKVLFCREIHVHIITVLLDYRKTLRSFIWVDEHSTNPYDLIKTPDADMLPDEIVTNPLILLSWICKKLTEIVVIGYFMDPMDVIGIARLRGSNLKVFEFLEDDICFDRHPCLVPYNKLVSDVSNWLKKDWKPLSKNNLFVNHTHYIIQCTSQDLTPKLDY